MVLPVVGVLGDMFFVQENRRWWAQFRKSKTEWWIDLFKVHRPGRGGGGGGGGVASLMIVSLPLSLGLRTC